MARTPTPAPPATPSAAPPVIAPNVNGDLVPGFNWSDLPASIAAPTRTTVVAAKVDVLTEVPEPIRIRAEMSLAKTVARIKAKANSQAARVRIDPAWQIQEVFSEQMGKEFARLLTRYCKYRPADKPVPHADSDSPKGQVTVRVGNVQKFKDTADGWIAMREGDTAAGMLGVRYAVKPFETRKGQARLPGTV